MALTLVFVPFRKNALAQESTVCVGMRGNSVQEIRVDAGPGDWFASFGIGHAAGQGPGGRKHDRERLGLGSAGGLATPTEAKRGGKTVPSVSIETDCGAKLGSSTIKLNVNDRPSPPRKAAIRVTHRR